MEKRCRDYVGASCVNGTCPKAWQEEYEEHCISASKSCRVCWLYEGCKDCALAGTEYCDKGTLPGGGVADV